MARMYRAGTAFVQIVPSFDGMQKRIAKNLNKDLKKALSDKDVYSGLERNLEESFRSALGKATKETREDVRNMVKEIDKETVNGARTSARQVKKVVKDELGGGWYGAETRKIGEQVRKALGADTLRGMSKEYSTERKKVQDEVDLLSKAFTKGGENDAREIQRSYTRLKKAVDKLKSLDLSARQKGNLNQASSILGGDNYQRIANGLSNEEIKDLNARNRKLEQEQGRSLGKLNSITENANREARRIDNEEAKRQQIMDARNSERARQRLRDVTHTRASDYRELGQLNKAGTPKQERLANRRDRTIENFRGQINDVMRDLAKLNAMRPLVSIESGPAVREFNKLRAFMNDPSMKELDVEVNLSDDFESQQRLMRNQLRDLKQYAERTLSDVDFDVDFNDTRATVALNRLKAAMQELRDREVELDVDVDFVEFDRLRGELLALRDETVRINVQVNDDGAYDDVVALEASLDAITDKRVGVDITEREAMAQIAAIEGALSAIDDEKVNVDIDYDKSLFQRFARDTEAAQMTVRRLGQSIKNANVSMSESTQAFRIFNPLLAGVAFLGAPAVSTLGGITAGLGAISSMLPGVVGGFSTLGFAFGGLEDAMKKYEKAQEALAIPKKDLTAAQKDAIEKWEGEKDAIGKATVQWIEYVNELKTGIAEVQKGAREGLFPGLQAGIETVMDKYAEPFKGFLYESGRMLGLVAEIWSTKLTTDDAAEWFKRVGEDSKQYMVSILQWLENTAVGFAHLTDAFRPFAREFSEWLVNSSGRFSKWAGALSDNPKFEEFLDSIRSTLPLLGDLAKNVGELFINLTIAVEPFSIAILGAINGALDFLNAMDPAVLGAIVGAVGGLTAGLMILSGVIAGAGALAMVLGAALSTPFTAAISAVASFVVVNSTALGTITAIDSATGGLSDVMGSLGGALDSAANFARDMWGAIGGLAEALAPLMPVLSELVGDVIRLGVAIGGEALGALTVMTDIIGALVTGFTSLPEWVQEAALIFGGLSVAALGANKGMSALKSGADTVTGAIAALIGGISGKTGQVTGFLTGIGDSMLGIDRGAKAANASAGTLKSGLLGLGAVTGVLAGITAGFMLLTAAQEDARKEAEEMQEKTSAGIEGLSRNASNAGKVVDEAFTRNASFWELGMGSINGASDAMEHLAYGAERTKGIMSTNSFWESDSWIAESIDLINEFDDSLAGMVKGGNISEAALAYQELAAQAKEAGLPVSELTRFSDDYVESLQRVAGKLGVNISDEELLAAAREGRIPEALRVAMEANGGYEETLAAVGGKLDKNVESTRELIAAQDELTGRLLTQEEANTAYYEAMDKFNEYVKTAKGGIDEQTKAGRENREEIKKMASATRAKADADLEATGDVGAFTNTLWDQRKALIAAAEKMGANTEEAQDLANTVLEIPENVTTKAELKDWASDKARDIQTELKKIKTKINIDVALKYYEDKSKLSDLQKKYPGARIPAPPVKQGYHGGVMEFYANGGLRPMDPIAQMVQPNTWRVVGDRGDVPEAYVPLNGSERSWSILLEAIKMMPGAIPFHDGGVAMFANGAIASTGPVAAAPAAEGSAEGVDATAITDAFAVVIETLGASWQSLLDGMLTALVTHFALVTEATTTGGDALIAVKVAQDSTMQALDASHLSILASTNAGWRAGQISATSAFFEHMLGIYGNGNALIRGSWSGSLSEMSERSGSFRSSQYDSFNSFLNGTMLGLFSSFGDSVNSNWSATWNRLISSATSIFSVLPTNVGQILSSTSGKMNTHIVDPYNKVVKDLDLKDNLKIARFPVQKYATGTSGVLPGYTPGRDIYSFFSPEVGQIDLSGGEHILRPEVGAVIGSEFTDAANAAARNGGIAGVKKYLGQSQAFADGGVVQSFAKGGQIQKNRAGLIQLGKVLQGLGVRVSEHSAFGGNSGGHAPNSWHNRDGALDLNTAPGTSAKEMRDFDRIMPILYKLGWGTIWRYPNHYGHAHVDIGNRSLGSFNRNPKMSGDLWETLLSMKVGPATGGGDSVDFFDLKGEMAGWIKKAQSAIGDDAIPALMGQAGGKIFTELADAKADKFIETASVGYGNANFIPGSGVKRWTGIVREALEKTGNPTSDSMINIVLRRMNQESGGNPKAINNWDSNARRGTPSKGLMQVIDPTFAAYRDKSVVNNIWDPLANILASMRYAKSVYGSLPAAYNKRGGYADGTSNLDLNPEVLLRDNGGPLPQGYSVVHNNLAHEETIIPKTVNDVVSTFERLEQVTSGDGLTIKDSYFGATAQEVVQEIGVQRRMARAGTPVKF